MNRRDIELLISARETTGRSFKAVTSNIDSLNRKIEEQVAAAERGEVSLQDLRKSQQELAQAGRDLSALQGQIDSYRRLEEQQKKNSTAAESAAADFAKLKAELAGLEAVTAKQERALAGLEKKVRTTSAAYERSTVDINKQAEVLDRAGIEVAQLDAAQTKIVTSARAAGAGFASLGTSIDSYADNLRIAREGEQNLAAQNAFGQKLAQARELGEASRFVQLYAQAVGTVAQTDNQLAALDGFRAVGQQAAEASRDISQFVQVGKTMAVTGNDVAQGLRAIIQPGTEALRTLDGVEAAIAAAAAKATAEKGSVAGFSAALNDLSQASAALVSQGGLIDGFERQAAAVAVARQQFDSAQADVQRYGAAMAAADVPTEALSRSLTLANAKLAETGRALSIEETKLGELSRSLKTAGIDTNNLAAAQARLQASATQAAGAIQAGNQRLGRGGEKANGLFGLNPFELQNLSFQLNDIFVSLASGQKPLTVLFQQGSQIAQIFPGLLSSVAKFAVILGPLVAIVGGFAFALSAASTEASQLKEITSAVNGRNLTDSFDVAALQEAANGMEALGVSTEEATASLLAFLDAGASPEQIIGLTESAANLAEVLGIDVAEATEILTDILGGGIDAVDELALSTNLLTVEEINHANALFEAGKSAEARQYILDQVNGKLKEQAAITRGSFTPAVNNLKVAFANFGNYLRTRFADDIAAANSLVGNFIGGLTTLTGLLAGKGFGAAVKEGAAANRAFTSSGKKKGGGRGGATDQQIRDNTFLRELDEEEAATRAVTNAEKARLAGKKALRDAQKEGVSASVAAKAAAQAERLELEKLNAADAKKASGKKKKGGASKAEREAKAAERKIDSLEKRLENQLRSLDSATGRGKSATLEERLAVVDNKYQSIFDTLEGLDNLGIKAIDGRPVAEIKAEVEASKEILKNEERIKFFEDQIGLLTTQRKDEIENIEDAQERGAKSTVEAYRAAEEVNARISPQIVKAAQDALAVARAIAGATPSPEMASLIARLERIINGEGTTDIVQNIGLGALGDQEGQLNKLLKERNDLVESYNTLNELGLLTDAEARQMAAQGYKNSSAEIALLLPKMRETLELLRLQKDTLTGLPLISDAAYNAWLAKLQAVEAGLVQVDVRQKAVQDAARGAIQQGVTNAFQTAADAIVGLVAGTMSFGDAIKSVFTTALQFAADFLSAIAEVLVQMVALQVAKSLISAGSGGFGGFLFHSGGVVGASSGRSRSNIGGSWLGAPKLHTGGGMGLRPDEYKAVLQLGEEVLTEDDPRHVRNIGQGDGGGGGGGGGGIKQVLVLDPEAVPAAMQSRSGEKSILTVIKSNIPTIKQMLG